jgi:hypothetical protein
VQLRQTIADVGIPRNAPFRDMVLLKSRKPHVEQLGGTTLTVLGPTRKNLERLRQDWRAWIHGLHAAGGSAGAINHTTDGALTALMLSSDAALVTALSNAARMIEATDPDKVTPPNRASITLLAEERGRTCLLTGDANEEELLQGLRAAKKLGATPFRCNVVKVQHHGSENNLSTMFTDRVLGDNYVFCADGNHGNPDPSVVKTIVEAHLGAATPVPTSFWFNCSVARTKGPRQDVLKAAIAEARRIERLPGSDVHVLDDRASALELDV